MIPGLGGAAKEAQQAIDRGELKRTEAIIRSMTPGERRDPDILNASRRRRIARGSGTIAAGGQPAHQAVRRDAEDDAPARWRAPTPVPGGSPLRRPAWVVGTPWRRTRIAGRGTVLAGGPADRSGRS